MFVEIALSYQSKMFSPLFQQSIPICLYFWIMQYGICPLSIVPLRAEPKNASEQTSQLLYGEFFIILNKQKSWSKIQNTSDGYEGWVITSTLNSLKVFSKLQATTKRYSTELVDFIWKDDNILFLP